MRNEGITSIAEQRANWSPYESRSPQESEPIIHHNVRLDIMGSCGIPEGEPAAIVMHTTQQQFEYDITKSGFVNVSGRGTLSDATEEISNIADLFSSRVHRGPVTTITFCVPAKYLRRDPDKYGLWFDMNLADENDPKIRTKLQAVYDSIAVKYDPFTGKPTKYARDNPKLYPVYIPKQYILGVARSQTHDN